MSINQDVDILIDTMTEVAKIEAGKAFADLILYGFAYQFDGKHVPIKKVVKVTKVKKGLSRN